MQRHPFEKKEEFELQLHFHRKAIVFNIARRLHRKLARVSGTIAEATEVSEWISVESLSQLRSIVGGRFATVKSHWIASGFPLRAHRGDRSRTIEFNEEGWLAFSLWLDSQGYISKVAHDQEPVCFMICPKNCVE